MSRSLTLGADELALLVARAAEGDEQALNRFGGWLYTWLPRWILREMFRGPYNACHRRLCGRAPGPDEAIELSHEVWADLFQDGRIRRWDPRRSPRIEPYIQGFVQNVVRRHVDRMVKQLQRTEDLGPVAEDATDPLSRLARAPASGVEDWSTLQALFSRLHDRCSPRRWEIFWRMVVLDQPAEQVAEALGTSKATVSSELSRARELARALRAEVLEPGRESEPPAKPGDRHDG